MSKKSRKNGGPRSGGATTPASRKPRSSGGEATTSTAAVAKATPAPAPVTRVDTPAPAAKVAPNAVDASRANGDRDTLITPLSPIQSPVAAASASSKAKTPPPSAVTVAPPSKKSKQKGRVEAAKAAEAAADEGETSIPPVADLDEQFFSEREPKVAHLDFHADDLGLDPHHDARFAHKMSPAVRARRQRFAGYVKIAVGVCGAVVLAAVVRVAGNGTHDVEPVNLASAMTSSPAVEGEGAQPKHAPPTVTVEQIPAPTTAVAPVAAAAPSPAAPAPVEAPKPAIADAPAAAPATAAAVPVAAAPAEPPSDAPAKSALDEKKDARTALERGQTKKAIEAGERSVALDATDGEAWLLLGAAYQEAGRAADAHRAFASCAKEAKKGPIGECRAMLR